MSGRPDAFMPFYIGDYLADTSHLTAAEHGAYILLIIHYWRSGVPLLDDDKLLNRISRMTPAEWKRSRSTIRAFFKPAVMDGDHVLTHTRIEKEMLDAGVQYNKSKNRTEAARLALQAKRDAQKAAEIASATDTVTVPLTETVTIIQSQSQSHSPSETVPRANALSSEFDDWYAAYPKHEAPGHAEKAYKKARKTATAAELLAAATRYAELRSGEDAKFTKLPATWLNARCWMDEPVRAGTPMKIPKNRLGFVDLPADDTPEMRWNTQQKHENGE